MRRGGPTENCQRLATRVAVAGRRQQIICLILIMGAVFPGPGLGAAPPAIEFNRDIRPIFARNCYACHGPDDAHRQAQLRLDRRADALAHRESGSAIAPGEPSKSLLIARVASQDPSERMPPADTGLSLSLAEIDRLRAWISQGAQYNEHWAFQKPTRPPLPIVSNKAWCRNGIDHFILGRLDRERLTPSFEAPRAVLLRRLSLDLRGLPPTLAEVDAFEKDNRPDAYERQVDRFLADPAYGERWARLWLDVARYADSAGYGSDPLRTIWRYRDWVIDAFNRNLPYDRFTIDQLAGDLVSHPSDDQILATAFHRNTMTNTEGGTDDEEFRTLAVKDRADTTFQAWMGLTLGCAKCHNHKYDPISQKEYYQVYAIFNQTEDNDQPTETPIIPSPTAAERAELARIETEVANRQRALETMTPALAQEMSKWERDLSVPSTWSSVAYSSLQATAGGLKLLDDGSVLVDAPRDKATRLDLSITTHLSKVTGIRVEAIPDPLFPTGGSGLGPTGDFRVVRIHAARGGTPTPTAPKGRFIRVELPGKNRILSLAEVQVFAAATDSKAPAANVNLARTGKATQSSDDYGGDASRAIDGNTNGDYSVNSTTHTKTQKNPWWEVDLGAEVAVDRVTLWNRTDSGLQPRLQGAEVRLLDSNRKVVKRIATTKLADPSLHLTLSSVEPVLWARATSLGGTVDRSALDALIDHHDGGGWRATATSAGAVELLLCPAAPIALDKGMPLSLRLEMAPGQSLGRFRVSLTDQESMLRRGAFTPSELAAIDSPAPHRTDDQKRMLQQRFLKETPSLEPVRKEIARLNTSRPTVATVPIAKELPSDRRRATHLMIKGNFLDKGERVEAGTPASLPPWPTTAPLNRLGLAQWLTAPENPLTARVAVNRFWGAIFSQGLVATDEDFGTQADPPTHPELLDWLAVEFIESHWDIKRLIKLMVMSATYRQSSRTTPEHLAKDPRNNLLSRAPRVRLEAEMVRDQALAVSGLLERRLGGPSVYPPQPDGLWQPAFNGQRTWPTSTGPDRYRRGLYTFWRRTIPYPSMATFDAPSREICSLRRPRTNTPLQALVTLNDTVYVEAARALAARMVREGGAQPRERAMLGMRLCLGHAPEDRQLEALLELYEKELARYRGDRVRSMKLIGATKVDNVSPEELAAWTVVANVLLNLDAFLTKG